MNPDSLSLIIGVPPILKLRNVDITILVDSTKETGLSNVACLFPRVQIRSYEQGILLWVLFDMGSSGLDFWIEPWKLHVIHPKQAIGNSIGKGFFHGFAPV